MNRIDTPHNRRRLAEAIHRREPLMVNAIMPDPTVFDYDEESGIEICFAPVEDRDVVLLVSQDLTYHGSDPERARLFSGPDTGDGWRPAAQITSRDAEALLRLTADLLGIEPPPETERVLAESVVASDGVGEPDLVESSQFGEDLVELARRGSIGEIVGRDREVEALIRVNTKYGKNAACLVGEPGVGKTAIVEKLALRIVNGAVPASLVDVRLLSVNLSFLAAGATYKNEYEGRLKQLLDEARDNPRVLLFFDEVHSIVSPAHDASQMIKADLGRGRIRVIGATTNKEWRMIEQDSALARRFQVIPVAEPTPEETLQILKGLKDRMESHHQVVIPDDVLEKATTSAVRYVGDRRLPDKAIDLLDEASAVTGHRTAIGESAPETLRVVDIEAIHHVLSAWTGIPEGHFEAGNDAPKALKELSAVLSDHLFGQDEAIEAVVSALQRKLMIKPELRGPGPIAVLLLAGPSGTGKTETARLLAEKFFGDTNRFLKRIDLSEFSSEHTIARLVGSPPGYVGHGQGGELTNKIRQEKTGALLLDEFEKAHPAILSQALLPLLGDGIIHDMNTGEIVDARQYLIILTSNMGTNSHLAPDLSARNGSSNGEIRIMQSIRAGLPNELLGRIDEIVMFKPLERPAVEKIGSRLLAGLEERLSASYGAVTLEVQESAIRLLLSRSMHRVPQEGARAVQKAFRKTMEDPAIRLISEVEPSDDAARILRILVDGENNIRFSVHSRG